MSVTVNNRSTFGFKLLGFRNLLLLLVFVICSIIIYLIFPYQGLDWISFVVCSSIICLGNLFILIKQYKIYSSTVQIFVLFRISWSFAFSSYMLLIAFSSFHGFGLSVILFFFILVFLDIFTNLFFKDINNLLGPPFIPYFN